MKRTQKKLAISIGYSPRHLNQVLKGRLKPSIKLAKIIQQEIGIPWTSCFEETPERTKKPVSESTDA